MNQKTIITRFAPSPTGYLHIGGLRTALYSYLYAKQHNGKFFLRIEDTDQTRLVEDSVQNIIDTLQWAGLDYDEGPGKEGTHGPYVQSERLSIYQEQVQKLIETDHAYRCFCTKERLDEMREAQVNAKKAPMYDRTCRYLSQEEIQAKLDAKTPFVIRQAIPLNRLVKFTDKVRGKTTFDTNTLDDHVLLKSDGFPTYHLAVVIDDHFMEVTDVIRGEEWLPSTPKHLLLYEAFGFEPTTFAHLPLLLNKDRSKLSKRQNDVSTQSYIDKGYSKEAIINFIAMLGWNTSDNQEIYTMQDLIEQFSIERVQKGGAIFDLEKLNWYDWQHKRIQYLQDLTQIANTIDPKVTITEPKKGQLKFQFESISDQESFRIEQFKILLKFIQKHLSEKNLKLLQQNPALSGQILSTVEEKILKEPDQINHNIQFFFEQDFTYETELFQNPKMDVDSSTAKLALQESLNQLEPTDFTTEETLLNKFKLIISSLNLKNGQVLWPVRIALTNQEFSPGVFEIAHIYGFEKTKNLLQSALKQLSLY